MSHLKTLYMVHGNQDPMNHKVMLSVGLDILTTLID